MMNATSTALGSSGTGPVPLRFGFLTLGDLTPDPDSGERLSARARLEEIIQAAELTEELGFDSYGVGEHHTAGWVVTAPPVVLAAIGARTSRIRLRTGVTLLANLDPVRAAEDYATVDLLSGGRLELTAARGTFPQPWRLFGQNVDEQRERLAEAIDLLSKIWSEDPVDWSGSYRSALSGASIGPRPLQSPPPIWCGVASSPESVEFAAQRGLPIMAASVFRTREHVGSLIDHYREQAVLAGHDEGSLEVGVITYLYIREDGDQARREFEHFHSNGVAQLRSEMDAGTPLPDFDYAELMSPGGPMVCGTPQEAVEKLVALHGRFRHDLHIFHTDMGGMPWRETKRTMELFAAEVAPALNDALAGATHAG
jgi:alkanesulfonate monooxygenase SsuD/methylene tetrahydromethanopterin reductase-like flavin-dependent oxidoreductase (luciferase family)